MTTTHYAAELSRMRRDGMAGFTAGFLTGAFVTPFELAKVYIVVHQGIPPLRESAAYVCRNSLTNMPFFCTLFGAVCAMEFSVNARVNERYGPYAGCVASAFTGAAFLSSADHLLLFSAKVHPWEALLTTSPLRLMTGFTPMVVREAVWISVVCYSGPALGRLLQRHHLLGRDTSEENYKFVGRLFVGVGGAFVSHPFDTTARMLQIAYQTNPSRRATYGDAYQHLQRFARQRQSSVGRELFRGVAPRLVLAATGGALAGAVYERVRPYV